MGYTLGQAAEATGKAKSTILKSIRAGRISAQKDAFENWDIQPSELHRVYPKRGEGEQNEQHAAPASEQGNGGETAKIRELEARLEAMAELLNEIKSSRDKTEAQLERERAEAAEWRRTITALLPPPQEQKPDPRPVTVWEMFWPWSRRA